MIEQLDDFVARFIEENIDLIEKQQWDKIYNKADDVPAGFTEAMLAAGINPLYQGLEYVPGGFLRNSTLESFNIPDWIETVGDFAFWLCERLREIKLPQNTLYLGTAAFEGCRKLQSINLGDALTKLKAFTFKGCIKLENVILPKNLKIIDVGVFDNCSSLTSLILPDGLEEIAEFAFRNCYTLSDVTIPKSISKINYSIFANCRALKAIKFNGTKQEYKDSVLVDDPSWRRANSALTRIKCLDGDIKLL